MQPTTPKRRKAPEPAQLVTARSQKLRAERASSGLVRLDIWCKPEHKEKIKAFAKALDDK